MPATGTAEMIMPGLAPGMIVFGVHRMGQRAASAHHRVQARPIQFVARQTGPFGFMPIKKQYAVRK
jgi:hypothetical protein